MSRLRRAVSTGILFLLFSLPSFGWAAERIGSTDAAAAFEKANQLYELGRFTDAAGEYRKLLATGGESAAIHYNLANTLYKAGRAGDAIAHYLEAARIAPRDRSVRANLEFVRGRLPAPSTRIDSWWEAPLKALTLNEWFMLAFVAVWLWGGLFVAGRLLRHKRAALRGYLLASGCLATLLTLGLAAATWRQFRLPMAVVVVREAAVRNGPLDESKAAFSLPEGAEVRLLERKSGWLLVRSGRSRNAGWIHDSSVHVVGERETGERRPAS